MKYIITAEELIDRGLWEQFCGDRGINVWAINEGQMDDDHEFILSTREAKRYGLI